MSDLNRIQTFEDGDLVTADKLKKLVDLTTINPTFVSSKEQILTAGVDKALDTILIYDNSGTVLKQIKVEELLKVAVLLPTLSATDGTIESLTTSIIDGQPNKGLLVTANDGVNVTGKSWVSANGLLVTVTSTAHGLATGAVLVIVASNAAYSADTEITVTNADTFTYTLTQTDPVRAASAGTLSYTQKGYLVVDGRLAVTGKTDVADLKVTGSLTSSGTATLGSATVTSLTIGGKTPMTTQENLSKVYVKSGSVTPAYTVEFTVYTSPTITVPSDETWIYEVNFVTGSGYVTGSTRPDVNVLRFRAYNNTTQIYEQYGSASPYGSHNANWMYTKQLTSADNGFILNIKFLSMVSLNDPVYYRVRLTKVKTSTLSDATSCI
jgi:hypothetical protein